MNKICVEKMLMNIITNLEQNFKMADFHFRQAQINALKMMLTYQYGIVYATCALGKTFIEAAYAYYTFMSGEINKKKVVVLISPRLLLNKQLTEEFKHAYDFEGEHVDIRNLSSDTSADGQTNLNNLKQLVQNRDSHILIITTPKSLNLYGDAFWSMFSEDNKVDCILWDECHKEANKDLRDKCQKFALTAFFLSATPDERIFTYKDFGCFQYTYTEALKDNIVVDFETYIIETEMAITNRNDKAAYDYAVVKDAFKHNHEILNNTNEPNVVLACCTSVESAAAIAEKAQLDQDFNNVDIYLVVSGKKDAGIKGSSINGINVSRSKIIDEIHGDITKDSLIIHCYMIQEGISVNGINGVVILGNKTDENMYQTVMRGARKNDKYNKKNFRVYYSVGKETNEEEFRLFCKKLYDIYPDCKFHFGLNTDELTGGKLSNPKTKCVKIKKVYDNIIRLMQTEWKHNINAINLEKEIKMMLCNEEPIEVLCQYICQVERLNNAGLTTNDVAKICGIE